MTTTGANTTVTGSTADPTTACASSAALHHTSVHTSHDLPHHDQRHSHQQQQPNSNSHHAGSRRGTEHHRPRHNIFKKTLHHISAEELEKLRDIIAAKNVIITKLSRKLSHARAYPLKGINEPIIDTDSDYEDYENTQNNGTGKSVQRVRKSSSTRMGSSAKFSALSAFNDGDDNASETASFLAEEEAHQQRRVEKAVEIQQMYNERAAKVKASNPPHIRAIREARSFSENVTKNIRRPQSAY